MGEYASGYSFPAVLGQFFIYGTETPFADYVLPLQNLCSQVSGDIVPDKINAPQVERQCCHNPGSVYPQISGNQDSLRIAMPYNMQDSIMGPC